MAHVRKAAPQNRHTARQTSGWIGLLEAAINHKADYADEKPFALLMTIICSSFLQFVRSKDQDP